MNIYEKLNKVQTRLVAPKGQYNSFGKYSYRSCEDILESVKPLLAELGLALLLNDSVEQAGEWFYIKCTATLINIEKPEEQASASAFAREPESRKGMDAAQVTGSTSSYARKYALAALLAIDDSKDSDYTNRGETSQSEPQRTKQAPANSSAGLQEQVKSLQVYLGRALGKDEGFAAYKTVLSQLGLKSSSELTEEMMPKAMAMAKNLAKA